MVKPIRILLLLFYIACITAVIMVLSPGEIRLTDTLSLNVFSLEDIRPVEEKQVDISDMVAEAARIDSVQAAVEKNIAQDSAKEAQKAAHAEKYEPVAETRHHIQYPDTTRFVLDKFFASLKNLPEQRELIRIVHYGDSQIEGDRISDYLRSRLQNKFGGCGVGMVPLIEKQASRSTLTTDFSGNWNKFAINTDNARRRYGLLGAYYRFSPSLKKDAPENDESRTYRSWVHFKETAYTTKAERSTEVENIKILYRSPQSRLAADIYVDGDTTISNICDTEEAFGLHEQPLKRKFRKVKINFESGEGSELYGVAFDCNEGVAVDNVPLRGSSGVEFTKMDKEFLRSHIEKLNVKLLILQFGVNVVPNPRSNYQFYEEMFYKQLAFLKSLSPDLEILVVGVSDMSRRQGTRYASYPNIPKVRDAQRNAAFRAGCAFWDLYEAMGGENSMQSWVNARPALAGRDFIHFNPRGAKVVGEMLYNAIIKEYDNYKKRNE